MRQFVPSTIALPREATLLANHGDFVEYEICVVASPKILSLRDPAEAPRGLEASRLVNVFWGWMAREIKKILVCWECLGKNAKMHIGSQDAADGAPRFLRDTTRSAWGGRLLCSPPLMRGKPLPALRPESL